MFAGTGGGLVAGSDPNLTWFDRAIVITREKIEQALQGGVSPATVEIRLTGDGREWIGDCTLKLTLERGSAPSPPANTTALLQDALKKIGPKIEAGR